MRDPEPHPWLHPHVLLQVVATALGWLVAVDLVACSGSCRCGPAPVRGSATVSVVNTTSAPPTVYVSLTRNSQVQGFPPFCYEDAGAPCSFPLGPDAGQVLPIGTSFFNATFSFGAAPACNVTVGEVTVNTDNGQDTTDISEVNGYGGKMEIDVSSPDGGTTVVGPATGGASDQTAFGLYPSGCDICVARQSPPCGITPCGSSPNDGGQGCGCKSGGQYDPTVPCQYNPVPPGQSYVVALDP